MPSGGNGTCDLGDIGALAIDPVTPSTLYAGSLGGGVFKSTDGGGTWTALNTGLAANIFVHALAIDPRGRTTVYAGTDSGVFDIEQVAACVVGTGTAASCTDATLDAALAGGGLVTFNCGGPAIIDVSTGTGTKMITADTTIDGGGQITISGGNHTQVFRIPADQPPHHVLCEEPDSR